jgi:DNA-binding NtrC family response regulator
VADSAVQAASRRPVPGLLVVFSRGKPLYHPVVLRPGEPMTVGREAFGGLNLGDAKMSTRHAELSWDGGFTVKDLGSRNGTSLDGVRVDGAVKGVERGVLKLGQTLVLLLPDVTAFTTGEVSTTGGVVVGPTMRAVLTRVALARREGGHLLVRGETGSGKELIAKAFHEAAARAGPLVAFNCANLQPGLAEARLFGTVKGAFNEARDTAGLFLQADGGVLFLDEIAELGLEVQAKLLRAIETGEVQRVGESSVKKVNVVVVAASHQSLQSRVKAGQFRQDLMFRLNQFEVHLPALKDRPEEIPWLMQSALQGRVETLHVSVVEAALLRPWPGNVRQLLSATGAAAANASLDGGVVKLAHLAPEAGLDDDDDEAGSEPEPELAPGSRRKPDEISEDEVVAALAECEGNATQAAKKLGLYRTQLSRLRQKFGLMKKKG